MNQIKDMEIIKDIATVAYSIWRRKDFDKVSNTRDLDDEFASRIRTASQTDSVPDFFENLARKWGIRCPRDDSDSNVLEIVKRYERNDEMNRRFLHLARNRGALIYLEMMDSHGDNQ